MRTKQKFNNSLFTNKQGDSMNHTTAITKTNLYNGRTEFRPSFSFDSDYRMMERSLEPIFEKQAKIARSRKIS